MSLRLACLVVAGCGFIALSYEIVWFRVYAYVSRSSPATFSLLLGFYLAGIALGAVVAKRWCDDGVEGNDPRQIRALSGFLVAANAIGFVVAPAVAFVATFASWIYSLVGVALAAGALGAALPLVSHCCVAPDQRAGQGVSLLYVANIVGSAAGSLVTGFVLFDMFSLPTTVTLLLVAGLLLAMALAWSTGWERAKGVLVAALAVGVLGVTLGPQLHDQLYERLQYKQEFEPTDRFATLLENRHGVISVSDTGRVYGGGVYDGVVSTSLLNDRNWIVRPYLLAAFHPQPKRVLMVGLSSGSWAQVIAHHPGVEELTVIEINPGYLDLIEHHEKVRGLRHNPKVNLVIDDGRRWLQRNEDERFDLIVQNTTWHWRAHVTNLLSREYLELARSRLAQGGMFLFNTTSSLEAMRTSLDVFSHGMRIYNCMLVSDTPVAPDSGRLRQALSGYAIEGVPVFDLTQPAQRDRLDQVVEILDTLSGPPVDEGLEDRDSLLARTQGVGLITDDNMLCEFKALHL